MFSTSPLARRKPAQGLVSGIALALSLAGGAVLGTAILAPTAMARSKKHEEEARPSYSKEFVDAYKPVADEVNTEGADLSQLATQLQTVVAAATTDDDKNAAGNLMLIAGGKTSNPAWQLEGLKMMVASGKTPPEQLGQFQWYIGNLSFQAGDYSTSRSALLAAKQAGYTENDPDPLIAETYFKLNDPSGGIDFILQQANAAEAAGQKSPESLLQLGLQNAYDDNLPGPALQLAQKLVAAYPSKQNWTSSLQVVDAMGNLSDTTSLDLLRLMRQTDTLSQRPYYVRYIERADPRIMSNEVVDVLNAAVAADQITTDENYYKEIKGIIDQRMAQDRADADSSFADASKPTATGRTVLTTGDLLYSLKDYARAEQLYAKAAQMTGVDASVATTRMGIAQVQQGKLDAAKATFASVTGSEAPVAAMWAAYVATQQEPAAPATPAAEPTPEAQPAS